MVQLTELRNVFHLGYLRWEYCVINGTICDVNKVFVFTFLTEQYEAAKNSPLNTLLNYVVCGDYTAVY